MNINIVGIVGLPPCYGGFETLVDNLVDKTNNTYKVYCSTLEYAERPKNYKNAKLEYIPLRANGISSILYDFVSIFLSMLDKRCSCILVLGTSGAMALPFARFFTRKKIVTNIDGLEWRRDKWGRLAKIFLRFTESVAVKWSHVLVSDNQAIYDYVKSTYGVESAVVAYGGDQLNDDYVSTSGLVSGEFALCVCRIEPENNCHMILEAFAANGGPIKFVGNWEASEYGRKLFQKYSKYSNIELIGKTYDLSVLYALRSSCKYYIHGHSAGGTNPSLVEIMFFGKPIFCFDCSYNRYTTEDKCEYFNSVSELTHLILASKYCSGESMYEIADRRYRWSVIRWQYEQLFNQ